MEKTIKELNAADDAKAAAYEAGDKLVAAPEPEEPAHFVEDDIDTKEHRIKSVRPCVAGDQWYNPEEPKYVVTFTSGLKSAYPHG